MKDRCICMECAAQALFKETLAKQDAALKARDPNALGAEERIERARKQIGGLSLVR